MRKISGLLGVLILTIGIAACGGGGDGSISPPPPPPPPPPPAVCPASTFCMTISNTFSPTALTVPVGTTVSWRNDAGTAHNVTWNDAAGRSAALAGDGTGDIGTGTDIFTDGTHTRLFNTAGVFAFHCTIHAGMNGTLTVQ
jgi:plastocyanin